MHFKENKEEIKRRAVFALLIIITAVLQNTNGLFPRIAGAPAMLLIPLTVCIAMFENDVGGMLFGLAAGVVWDFYSSHAAGFYGIILVTAGYACAYLIARYMRNNFVTATVYSFVTSFVCATLHFLIFTLPLGTQGAGGVYLKHYLVSVAYTTVLTPLSYSFVRMTASKFKKEESEPTDEKV